MMPLVKVESEISFNDYYKEFEDNTDKRMKDASEVCHMLALLSLLEICT